MTWQEQREGLGGLVYHLYYSITATVKLRLYHGLRMRCVYV